MINKKTSHVIFMFMAGILSISLSSCKEMLCDFLEDPNALHVEVVDDSGINIPEEGSKANATRVSYNGFSTTFDEGDAIGVYAFDGSKYINSNVKFTKQSDGTWLSDSKVVYSPNCTYYAYFPYTENAYTPTTTKGDVETKFADFISDKENNFWKEDQSSKANFTASNLMLASATASTDRVVMFKMKHERGLVLGNNPKWHYTYDPGKEYSLIPEFTGNIPLTQDNTLYFLLKPSTTTSVMGVNVKASAGKYVLADNLTTNSSPTYTYSTSKDGESWENYTSTMPEGLLSVTCNATGERNLLNFSVDVNHDEIVVPNAVSDVDLSLVNNDGTPRGSRETANCYMVHNPGTYRIPLVYGNAIKNGATNTSSYVTTSTGNVLHNFVNHKDAAISDPWIKNNGITVDGAKLIWQDAKGLISSVGIDGDYLTFTVSSDNYRYGNALLSATSNGTIVWSWHIWVTNETFRDSDLATLVTSSHTYKVAPANVGQVDKIFYGNYCKVRITANNLSYIMELPHRLQLTSVTNTFYQWGRKDAEPPSAECYDIEGNTFDYTTYYGANTIGLGIQNPDRCLYNPSSSGPYKQVYLNLWDTNQTSSNNNISSSTVKTVYDPCPPGFCVPTSNLYYYIGNNNNYAKWSSQQNGITWNKDSCSIFFPASGHRNTFATDLRGSGTGGRYWDASARVSGDNHEGYALTFYLDKELKWYKDFCSNGHSVRPVLSE